MRLLFAILITVAGCNDSPSGTKKDMGGTSGGICPDHPTNCQGTCCGSSCLNTQIDKNNCGGCNAACTGGTVCMGGHCGCLPSGAPCSNDQTCCPNAGCANLMTDIRNCGTCGHSCGDGATCVAGQCKCGNTACTGTDVCCMGACMASCMSLMPDMATSSGDGGLPGGLCDCRGLMDPLGSNDQCPLTSQCVGNNCCLEDQAACALGACPAGTCIDNTPCTPAVTPQ
jgi:hypothetical protein